MDNDTIIILVESILAITIIGGILYLKSNIQLRRLIKYQDDLIYYLNKLIELPFAAKDKEVGSLIQKINLQTATDGYKDDLITTLKQLHVYREEEMGELYKELSHYKNK